MVALGDRHTWYPELPTAGTLRDDIVEKIARTFFVDAWARDEEYEAERDPDYELPFGPGDDLMDVAPDTPRDALKAAEEYAQEIEKANKMSLDRMFEHAARIAGEDPEDAGLAEDFGFVTAMEALGHGISWRDDHPAHGLEVPSTEYSI